MTKNRAKMGLGTIVTTLRPSYPNKNWGVGREMTAHRIVEVSRPAVSSHPVSPRYGSVSNGRMRRQGTDEPSGSIVLDAESLSTTSLVTMRSRGILPEIFQLVFSAAL